MKIFPILTIVIIILIIFFLPRNSDQPKVIYTPISEPLSTPYIQPQTQESSQSAEVYDSFLVPKDLQ